MNKRKNILVIKLGAFGDLLLSLKPFQDIRAAHKDAKITLLTMPPFVEFGRQMPWIDDVIADPRPEWWQLGEWIKLRNAMALGDFDIGIDLQNKPRTRFYKNFFLSPDIQWSSRTSNSTYPPTVFERKLHSQEDLFVQLRFASIPDSGPLDLDWLKAPIEEFKLPERYVVLVPGSSAHLLDKRWPPQAYAEMARYFAAQGYCVVLVGTKADSQAIAAIKTLAEFVIDVSCRTSVAQLTSIIRGASAVLGNDTGPIFLGSMLGRPTLSLMSYLTDPIRSSPIGPRCAWIKEENVADITVDRVKEKIAVLIS